MDFSGIRAGYELKPNSTHNITYRIISFGGRGIRKSSYPEHRLAFLYMTGEFPKYVDHENLDGTDNRWSNLRKSTNSQNRANTKTRRITKTGEKGVYWYPWRKSKNWNAQIRFNYKLINLGYFETKEEAIAAHTEKHLELFGEFSCR